MSLARLVITAVLVEGRSKAAVGRDYGVSRRWVHELVRRFRADGDAGLEPRSRRPRTSPHRVPEGLEDEIVKLRKLNLWGSKTPITPLTGKFGERHASR